MTPERVAIVGSRAKYWPHADVEFARDVVVAIVARLPVGTVILSGDSPGGGVDAWARAGAKAAASPFLAHWPGTYTKQGVPFAAACFKRNTDIAEDCTRLVAVCPTEKAHRRHAGHNAEGEGPRKAGDPRCCGRRASVGVGVG